MKQLTALTRVVSGDLLGVASNNNNMKYMLANLGVNLVALACVGAGAYLAVNGKDGWGWFLFVGLLCAGSVTFKNDKSK